MGAGFGVVAGVAFEWGILGTVAGGLLGAAAGAVEVARERATEG